MDVSSTLWLLGFLFLASCYKAWRASVLSQKTESWLSTDGVVVWAKRDEVSRPFRYTGIQAIYGYEVDGKRYTGNRIYYCIDDRSPIHAMLFNTYQFLSKYYPDSANVTVYYDPKDPSKSCLRKGGAFYGYVNCIALFGIFVFIMAIAWFLSFVTNT